MTALDGGFPRPARMLVAVVSAAGFLAALSSVLVQPSPLSGELVVFTGLTILASFARVPLPSLGSLSLAYALVLAGMIHFGAGASTLAAVLGAAASSLFKKRRPAGAGFPGTLFQAGVIALSASAAAFAYLAFGGPVGSLDPVRDLPALLAYTGVFPLVNLGLVSIALELSGSDRAVPSLRASLAWSIPAFLAGSSMAVLLALLLELESLVLLLLAAPFAYLVHLAYRSRAASLDEERRHSQQTAALYRSITEALALAIEAKDENTEAHVRRVQSLCLGVGKLLRLSPGELEALRAASVLHDIGKIAVPEHILTKPGRLSPDEVGRMRLHPAIGADILSAVPFPYPLAPVVRHHHERWDGGGYPDGLRGEEIPLAARILAAVDCFDALTSDRPYRKALARDEALAFLRQESGRMFDPRVVGALVRNVDHLERGFPSRPASTTSTAALDPLPAGMDLPPEEALAPFWRRLRSLLPFKTLVVYLFDEERQALVARFALGVASDRLTGLVIPVGGKLSGWVALHQRPYAGRAHRVPLERDGSRFDFEDLAEDLEIADLRSALVAPLTTEAENLGVLALYDDESVSYGEDQQKLLHALACGIAPLFSRSLPGVPDSEPSAPAREAYQSASRRRRPEAGASVSK
jgi:hypothetical protein